MANEVAKLIFKAETSDIDKAVKRLGHLKKAANDAEKEVGDLGKAANKADDKVKKLGKESNKATKSMKGLGKAAGGVRGKLAGVIAGLVGVGTALAFADKFNEVNQQFAIMQGQLVTATGSAAAAADEFERLKKFAATTPFDLAQSVDGFVKLKNLGLDPSQESMRSFGNTAAAMGKSLNQMIEAVADASTGEFERLKEFGIKSKTEGDKVSFVFQGVTTTVGKNAEEITGYLAAIGNEKFGDAMANQAASFAGATSNLQDSFDNLFREAGAGGALESMTESFRDLSTSLGTPEAIRGAQAIANMMAAITGAASVSLGGLLEMIGAMSSVPSAGLDANALGDSILAQSVERVGPTPEEVKLREKIADAEERIASSYSVRGYKLAKADAEELKKELENLLASYIPFENMGFDSLGGVLQDPTGTFNMTADAQVDTTPEIPMALEGQSAAEAAAQAATAAAQAEKDRQKAIETEFAEWKKEQEVTELDLLKEGYLLKEEAHQAHMDEMFRIDEVNRTVKKELDDTSFLSAAAGNKSHTKFMEKAKKGEIKLEELTGKQKLKIGVGIASDILGAAAQNSEKAFKLQKGLKIAETIQSTYSSATGAYDALADIPYVGPALGIAAAAAAVTAGMMNVNAIRSTTFNKGGGGGGGGRPAVPTSTGGGRVSASSMADASPLQLAANDEAVTGVPNIVNVTVDGTIDPTGARRIIEAINEATEDGLEINALVGT